MAIFAITFRIEDDSTYASRYNSVVAAIKGATTSTYWDEPTSFFLIESGKNSADVAAQIDANSTFDSKKDLLLVINLSQKGYKVLGHYTDKDLDVLLKKR
jgi:hypothetical protein